MLCVKNLSITYEEHCVVQGVSFQVSPGQALHLCGANGSGKSSIIKAIVGLLNHYEGQCNVVSDLCCHLHETGLHPDLTALENLLQWVYLTKDGKPANVRAALLRLGCAAFYEFNMVKNLSKGQLQRAALAKFVLSYTKLWVLDEPFTNLDSSGIQLFNQICQEHIANKGAIIIASHQPLSFSADTYYL